MPPGETSLPYILINIYRIILQAAFRGYRMCNYKIKNSFFQPRGAEESEKEREKQWAVYYNSYQSWCNIFGNLG